MEALELVAPPEEDRSETVDLAALNADLDGATAEEVVEWAAKHFGERLVMTSSFGAHSALMLHLASRVVPNIQVIFLDTGYLFPETYQFAEDLRRRFKVRLEVFSPAMTAARMEALHGRLYNGDEEELARYQQVVKVEPMARALRELDAAAWLAGLRSNQTSFRAGLRRVVKQNGILKVHPILGWSREDVDRYFERHDLPFHPLYRWGYRSIGDAHSTVPVDPEEMDDRAGRRLGEKRECGIHLPDAETAASLKSSGL